MNFLVLLSLALPSLAFGLEKLPPPCDREIYCYGELLKTVQLAHLYNDSKTFVDMPLVHHPNETLEIFDQLMQDTNYSPSKQEIQDFVDANFKEAGSAFVSWDPEDWHPNPAFLLRIENPDLREWARHLHRLWKDLGRKMCDKVKLSPEMYSLIYVDHPVIVPGGRFREFYYWDSYWTMEGLLLSEMNSTIKGMLSNFLHMVETYGMVPNGGRVYYMRRSQPPYLIPMIKLYMDHLHDIQFLSENIHLLEKEFNFWQNNRSVEVQDSRGKIHKVARYYSHVDEPRPESYREDYNLANSLSETDRQRLYVDLKSGAESGWDFSSRWFITRNGSNDGTLKDTKTSKIAPVDLNSLLCHNAKLLSEFFAILGDNQKSQHYLGISIEINRTMAELFWDDKDGIWYFYLSNVHPLWSDCFGLESPRSITVQRVIDYLHKVNVTDYIGGVPTSRKNAGQQWDFPNGWPPLQHLVIMGLHQARNLNTEAELLAYSFADKWVKSNYLGYYETKAMFEKYNVTNLGVSGEGGEYNVQIGFGWTNGVAMSLLNTFGDRLNPSQGGAALSRSQFSVGLMLLLSSLLLCL